MSIPVYKQTVLVVDHRPDNLAQLEGLLTNDYVVQLASNGPEALAIAKSGNPPNLILLDARMPCMDGYEVCQTLKSSPETANTPVILLISMPKEADKAKCFDVGAADYLSKPISPRLVKARVKTHLAAKATNDFLEEQIVERTRAVFQAQDVTIYAMASLAETRDSDTGRHIRRTQSYVKALATKLKTHQRFSRYLTDTNIDTLVKSAPLHDIGKVGIPDHILLKPGRLDTAEIDIMKTHTTIGRDAIDRAEAELGTAVDFLSMAKQIAYGHHEKWDGTGYPNGIAGDDIPICARLMAVADVYDALRSQRAYKAGKSHAEATQILKTDRGTHFDPDMIDAFVSIQQEFVDIADRLADEGPQGTPPQEVADENKEIDNAWLEEWSNNRRDLGDILDCRLAGSS